eukprot:c20550_g1_i5.p1 GENE.c20550_g1_i5~~c20550_g1_i5.p1  ORF type:complete len:154 (+),score=21.24 c20550_g1_i5:112-573(+)
MALVSLKAQSTHILLRTRPNKYNQLHFGFFLCPFGVCLLQVDEIARQVQQQLSPDANIIFGSTFDPSLGSAIRVTLIVTGLKHASTSTRTSVVPPASPPPPPQQPQPQQPVVQAQAPTAPIVEPSPQAKPAAPEAKAPEKTQSGLWGFFLRHW